MHQSVMSVNPSAAKSVTTTPCLFVSSSSSYNLHHRFARICKNKVFNPMESHENTDDSCSGDEQLLVQEVEEISRLQFECTSLRAQMENQAADLKISQIEIQHLRNQILEDAKFCSSLGAILGDLGWRASQLPEVVDLWLSMNKLADFLTVAWEIVKSFIEIYDNGLPPVDKAEYKLLRGLLGIVTNVTACPRGRQFLITDPNGKKIVEELVRLMPIEPLSSATVHLRRLLLMMLYNVSINETGLLHLYEAGIGKVLGYYLQDDSQEIKTYCLRILGSITYDIPKSKYLHDLSKSISVHKIREIADSTEDPINIIAQEVLQQLQNCVIKYEHSGNVDP